MRADDITGSARNESRSQLAAGDEVILVRLDNGRQEARAKTSALGAFAFHVPYAGKPYLVRVIHQGVAYEQKAFGGDALSIPVFDAARQIAGVTGRIEILRAEVQGNLLRVSDMYEITNQSSPPLTLARRRTFEVYLPAAARIRVVWAAGPENVRAVISVLPISDVPGHYAVNFPLRPGATKFGFEYDLPYRGDVTLQTRCVYPLEQFAVMIPPTMRFTSRSGAFLLLNTGDPHYQVRAANHLKAGERSSLELSGSGQLPPLLYEAKSQPMGRAAAPFSPYGSRPTQIQPPSQAAVMDGVILMLLATCAVLVWRARRKGNAAAPTAARQAHSDERHR